LIGSPTDGLPTRRRRVAFLALAIAITMSNMSLNITNTALPAIARQLHVSPAASIWITNAFQLTAIVSLFACIGFGQVFGWVRVYRVGVWCFIIGSIACAFAPNLAVLISGRIVQGVGAAAVQAITPVLLRDIFPRAKISHAFGLNAMIVAISTTAGPPIGAFILAIASWPWIFAINLPLGAVNLALNRALPQDDRNLGWPDLPSIVASAIGFTLIIWGINTMGHPSKAGIALPAIGIGALAFGWFVVRQRTLERPILAVDLFRIRSFNLAGFAEVAGFVAQALANLSLPYLLQRTFGTSTLTAALLLAPWPAALAISAAFAGPLTSRISPSALVTYGLGILTAGLVVYATLPLSHLAYAQIVIAGIVSGVGFGLFKSMNERELMMSAPASKSGSASGALAGMRITGQTLGATSVAIVFTAFGAESAKGAAGSVIAHACPVALWIASSFTALALVASFFRLPAAQRSRPRDIKPESIS
jgi:DHA2 family multidrug resistance protein-like MFS transporter